MKVIIKYLREYFAEEWDPRLFLSIALLLVASFVVNYSFLPEASIVRQLREPWQQFVFFSFYYGIPYCLTLIAYSYFKGRWEFWRDRQFLFLMLFAFVLLSAYIASHNVPAYALINYPVFFKGIPKQLHWYAVRYASNLLPGIIVIFPLVWYWRRHDRGRSRLYGFSTSQINLKTYFSIIVVLIPIVVAASFGSDFQSAYPRLKFGLPQELSGLDKAMLIGGFEVCYGIDFVVVEWLFRGFLLMAFSRYLGSGAILPMTVAYALIHFQKPMGEAIGSVAGGLVLGVIAYRTGSIYGGIILHLGIAYLMETAGVLHRLS